MLKKIVFSLIFIIAVFQLSSQTKPLQQGHAHNDYEHKRPLLDALEMGFCSIEVDVWLVKGELLVAHDRKDVSESKTLTSLYLEPLRKMLNSNQGKIYDDGTGITLLVDFKSSAGRTYSALKKAISEYSDILTSFSDNETQPGPVTIIISGKRPIRQVKKEKLRYAGIDGRLSDLKKPINPNLYPLISDNWNNAIKGGDIFTSSATRDKVSEYIQTVHKAGSTIRFWNTPEEEDLWGMLLDLGVDLISTDDLVGFKDFMLSP
ncbi:MAG: phosphatidylinositol-specific phospholipase C/glycerophosphodiester phosphodiesterase family protein [Spirochaetaceae bacterium]